MAANLTHLKAKSQQPAVLEDVPGLWEVGWGARYLDNEIQGGRAGASARGLTQAYLQVVPKNENTKEGHFSKTCAFHSKIS